MMLLADKHMAMKACDDMLTMLWVNALMVNYRFFDTYIFDMTDEQSYLWDVWLEKVKTPD